MTDAASGLGYSHFDPQCLRLTSKDCSGWSSWLSQLVGAKAAAPVISTASSSLNCRKLQFSVSPTFPHYVLSHTSVVEVLSIFQFIDLFRLSDRESVLVASVDEVSESVAEWQHHRMRACELRVWITSTRLSKLSCRNADD